MGKGTAIEWCDYTFNPWEGCTRVSPGCLHCYAEALNKFFSGHDKPGNWGPGVPRKRNSASYWKKPVMLWNKEALRRRDSYRDRTFRRERVFAGSMCDILDPEVPIEWFADFVALIRKTPHLDWLLLSKRPEYFMERMIASGRYFNGADGGKPIDTEAADFIEGWIQGQAPDNVWMGASVEDQRRADERIPALLKIPAKVRFLSVEPLLERVALTNGGLYSLTQLNWVIVGGESGRDARPTNIDHIRDVMRQCMAASVPCFVKQLGRLPVFEYEPGVLQSAGKLKHKKGGDPEEWPDDLRLRQFPPPGIVTKPV